MRHWLVLTTVDVLARPNNREHHLLKRLASRFDTTHVVFRRKCGWEGARRALRDALVPSSIVLDRGDIRYIAVNPLLNHYEGMVRDVTGVSASPNASLARWTTGLAFGAVGPIGIFKDLATVGGLAAAAWQHGRTGRSTFCTALGPWAAASARILRASGQVGAWVYEDRDFEPGFIDSAIRRRWTQAMEVSGIRSADGVISISNRLAELRFRQTGVRAHLIPTGADVKQYPVSPGRRDPTIIYIGNVASWSGITRAVEALPLIQQRVPAARILIVGDGLPSSIRKIRETAERKGVGNAVTITGNIPHESVAEHLLRSGVGLACFEPTSLREYAMPLKLVEYMCAGVPAIATRDTESADVVERHQCGLAVGLAPENIADACIRLLVDHELWRTQSENGLRAAAEYDWSSLLEREWAVMSEIAGRRPTAMHDTMRL